jgi:hypothetical protein
MKIEPVPYNSHPRQEAISFTGHIGKNAGDDQKGAGDSKTMAQDPAWLQQGMIRMIISLLQGDPVIRDPVQYKPEKGSKNYSGEKAYENFMRVPGHFEILSIFNNAGRRGQYLRKANV